MEREKSLLAKIDALKKELAAVQSGEFKVLDGPQAEEGIREVYQLAVSCRPISGGLKTHTAKPIVCCGNGLSAKSRIAAKSSMSY